MRLRVLALPLVAAVALTALADAPEPISRVPRQASVTAACTPGGNPGVNPPSIAMARADHIEWRSASPAAVRWVITPKDPNNWPFAQQSFTGTPEAPAVTPQPLPSAIANHPYAYNVTVTCADGTTQLIDPDIIIGDAQ